MAVVMRMKLKRVIGMTLKRLVFPIGVRSGL
jgi:hypothetical protein